MKRGIPLCWAKKGQGSFGSWNPNQQINKIGAIATKCGLDQEERCFKQ